MDAKRLVIGSVVGGIVISATGYLVWGTLLLGFFESQMVVAAREAPVVWAVVASSLIHGLFITLALGWTDSGSPARGFKTGALLGLLVWLGVDLVLFGTLEYGSLTGIFADSLLASLQYGLTGVAVALVSRPPVGAPTQAASAG